MYPYSSLPQPLTTPAFYILLALSRGESHTYALKGMIRNDSLGSVELRPGALYPVVQRLHDEGLIDLLGPSPAGKSGQPRMHYAISEHGQLRLQEELQRLSHALKIAESAGLLATENVPLDIQRALLDLKLDP